MSYKGDAISHFQRNIRRGSDVLRDHITKPMSALVEARSNLILNHLIDEKIVRTEQMHKIGSA